MKDISRKYAGKVLVICVILLGSLVGMVKAGSIDIENFVESTQGNNYVRCLRTDNYPGVSDGLDYKDIVGVMYLQDCSGLYSEVESKDLWKDYRPLDSNTPFDLKLVYNGTISDSKNWLQFSFPSSSTFGNEPITLQSDRLPYGHVVDVKAAIELNGGIVPLIDVPAGTYGYLTPYGEGTLEIGTRLLADLDDSNEVNFEDFAVLAEDWRKGPGQYVGDICGPNGIPDGYVDNYDLAAFCEDWLKDINDPSTW